MIRKPLTLLLFVFLVACGASARQKTIRITYETASIADDELQHFKLQHGKQIVDEAVAAGKSKEQARAELDAFIAKVDHAQLTVIAVYRMVAAASALDDDRSLKALLQVAEMLKLELKDLGVLK